MSVLAEFPWVADPAAIIVLSFEGLTYQQATAPGRIAFMLPVPAGNVLATRSDKRIEIWLDAGASVLLAFKRVEDADQWQALLNAEKAAEARGQRQVLQ